MTKRVPSLRLRIVGYLLAAQLLSFSLGWVIATFMHLYAEGDIVASLNDLAYYRSLALIEASLINDGKGPPRIEASARLRAEIDENPRLKFAVFDPATEEILPGSSPELRPAFAKHSDIRTLGMDFVLDGREGKGAIESVTTPVGRFRIALFGYRFRFVDIFHAFRAEFRRSSVLSFYAAAPVRRHGLVCRTQWSGALRTAIDEVGRIEFDSLKQGIVGKEAPVEVRPFIDAVNAALARLEATASSMRRYTANAAHELRTPLAIMRARLEDAEEPTFKNDLKRDVSQLQAIVEQMLITERLTERQARLDEKVDLATTVRQIVSDYLPLALDCDRKLEFEAEKPPVLINGNRRAMECVVGNLVDNALRAEPPGGAVLIKVAGPTVEVIDHGEGVAPGEREKIFEPFWRKREATPGTGLGLAIAKELVDKLNGRIWVEETPGGGATFKVSLPLGHRE